MFVSKTGPDGVPLAAIGVEPVVIDEESTNNRQGQQLPQEQQSYGAIMASLVATVDDMYDETSLDQPTYQDLPFAILFLIHAAIMIWLAIDYGTFTIDEMDYNVSNWRNYVDDDNAPTDEEWQQFTAFVQRAEEWIGVYPQRILSFVIIPSAFIAYVASYLLTAFIIPSCPYFSVVTSLVGTFCWTIVVVALLCISGNFNFFSLLFSGIILGAVVYYLKTVWRLIPFAATNLMVALRGISANCGMYVVAFCFSIAGFLWAILWLYIFIGVMQAMDENYQQSHPRPEGMSKKDYNEYEQSDPMRGFVVFLLLLSLYWTSKILLNTIQVTVAGVMATWCFVQQEAMSCCSAGVFGSVYRSLTYSFGSICMGSLLQAIITAIRVMIEHSRDGDDSGRGAVGGLILCILECLVRCLEDVLEYFNQWAYVYVGIYGTSYLDSGRKVVELFKARGFTAFVTNDLVGYVLGFTNFSVGVMTGIIAIIIQSQVDKHHQHENDDTSFLYGKVQSSFVISMIVGFVIGAAVCSVMMNVIRGAVNTLIVCFADDPSKLEDNHPSLTHQMAQAWSAAFPDVGMNAAPQYSVVV